jgi:hypothetical protein
VAEVSAEPVSRHVFESRFVWRVFYAFAALAALSVLISVVGREAGRSIAMGGHTDDTSLAEVVIGNAVLSVPRNMIRFEAARVGGVAARLDLYMRWPDLNGYSDAARADFNHAGGTPRIIFLSLSPRMMSRDMSGRYVPIYAQLTEPTSQTLPGGLAVRHFRPASGYQNEILVTAARGDGTTWVARCLDGPAAAESLAACERDVHLGSELSLSYRFPREMLADWAALDESVVKRVSGLIRTAP